MPSRQPSLIGEMCTRLPTYTHTHKIIFIFLLLISFFSSLFFLLTVSVRDLCLAPSYDSTAAVTDECVALPPTTAEEVVVVIVEKKKKKK